MKGFSTTTLVLVSLFLLVAGAVADTIQVQNVQINSIGATKPVDIVLDTSTAGVAGYDITVSLSNSSVATITKVSYPSWAMLNESTTLPASSVRIRSVDLYNETIPSGTDVPFGSITLRGDAVGSTDVEITINEITSDDGDSVSPVIQSGLFTVDSVNAEPIIANHTTTTLSQIPKAALDRARSDLHIAYGHTSHGSQIISGMTGLMTFPNATYGNATYKWSDGISTGALDLDDYFVDGDLGNPDRTTWATRTRDYLNQNSDVNVVMWSWCGQVDATESEINTYLTLMNQLESDYPDVKFVYMTGHLDGSGADGNVNLRNEQIRNYARANNKILFDFADIESYDPDGLVNYMELLANDNCDYDSDGNGVRDTNWATEWQGSHIKGMDWYDCGAQHSQSLNANQKAYAAWWLWARLAGWDGTPVSITGTASKIGFFRNGFWITDYNGNYAWDGSSVDRVGSLGQAGDIAVIGDWNGDGKDKIGFFRNGFWITDYNGNYAWDGPSVDRVGSLGQAGDIAVVGDWNNDGKDKIGIFRNGFWITDYNGNYAWDGPSVDKKGSLGKVGDVAVVGDWNGDGKDKIGFFRNGFWIMDYNGNYAWDGSSVDMIGSLGQTGDTPVVGKW